MCTLCGDNDPRVAEFPRTVFRRLDAEGTRSPGDRGRSTDKEDRHSPHGEDAPRIRILLADDHPLVLDALEQLFRLEPDTEVVGRCTRGDQVVHTVRSTKPDILLLDLLMPHGDGLSVLAALQHEPHRPRVVLLTALASQNEILEAVRLGARGVVLKDIAPKVIVDCVRKVHAGGEWLDRSAMGAMVETLLRREAGARQAAALLTSRELELVQLVASGLRNKEVADRLHIAEGTVKMHLHNIYEKTRTAGRVALTLWAKDHGLV